jgi:hypothetical protein
MNFGKNRVQYKYFLWQFFRFEKFDTYFYVNGKELAEFTAQTANNQIEKIENYFQYSLDKRIIFIVYNKLSDFKQSNIGLISENDQTNIGGVTKIIDNKVFLYFEGKRKKFEDQIASAITEVVLNEMLYGTTFKDRLANSTLLTIPEWFSKGLISYVSGNWNFIVEDRVKDGIMSGRYEKFNTLTGIDAIYAGHSIWRYIAQIYGDNIIPNIVYLTRVHKNAENGILYVLGISFADLTSDWIKYYKSLYASEDKIQNLPLENQILRNPKEGLSYQQAKINQDGSLIAFTTNDLGQYKIWLYDVKTKKNIRIYKKEYKLDQITDFSYPLLAWHPSGKLLSFINEYKGKILFNLYEPETKKLNTTELFYFDKILDYSYSDDGFTLVLSAIIKGQSDIYVHNLAAHTNEQLTNDNAEDFNPRFINHSKQIIFSSNRNSDTLDNLTGKVDVQPATDIFIYNFSTRSNLLTRITKSKYVNETNPFEISRLSFTYLSDETGIINRFVSKYDSTINYIDTAVHYRYFTRKNMLSDYTRNINGFDINDNKLLEIFRYNGKDRIIILDTDTTGLPKGKSAVTGFRKIYTQSLIKQDSLIKPSKEPEKITFQEPPKKLVEKVSEDTIVNIYNYIFEQEKKTSKTQLQKKIPDHKKAFVIPTPRLYKTAFYNNYVVNQVDFSFLNASYQTFTGGAVYYNPGMNLFFKLGINDLFEDYKITGGIRFSVNFDSNEYLVSFENLKNRKDRHYIFHRQAFRAASGDAITKVYTHEIMYIEKWPFSQVSAVRGTVSMRYDREVFLSTDKASLEKKDNYKKWGGLKIEYIFDNTINKGLNLYNGTRYKIFAESYFELEKNISDLFVVGADLRHYQKIHREIILACRFAASTSFGRSRLIYYLGSVDNWFNFSTKTETFNSTVSIDRSQNFVYQTLATNMRGFNQNIRNGNSFALINNEIRIPIVKYFIRRPISNDFLSNFQIVGFYDVGTAWSGPSPYSKNNAYNYIYAVNGPVTVTIDRGIEPIVMGYGFGIHSRLLGYFVRADWAWGIEDNTLQPQIFYLSLSLDF